MHSKRNRFNELSDYREKRARSVAEASKECKDRKVNERTQTKVRKGKGMKLYRNNTTMRGRQVRER
jgi:hypothetical protein